VRLLSVDFDAFFPIPEGSRAKDVGSWLYDWGGLDAQVPVMDLVWAARAASFIGEGLALPATSGEERSFWDRLTLSPSASCCFADSHSYAAVLPELAGFQDCTELVHVDAHHDGGYPGSQTCRATCDNWTRFWSCPITMVYPRWKAWGLTSEPEPRVKMRRVVDNGRHLGHFDKVFVCRSSGWVPPWCEQAFWDFLSACPTASFVNLDGMTPRKWDPATPGTVGKTVAALWESRGDLRQWMEATRAVASSGAVIHLQNEVGSGLKTPVIPEKSGATVRRLTGGEP
jgi:hypothetical protein